VARRANRVNIQWQTPPDAQWRWEHVAVEVLMDIRAELQILNGLLHCQNFVDVPAKLDRIAKNTRKRRAKPKIAGKPKLRVVRS